MTDNSALFLNTRLSDVTIHVGGEKLPAHKLILAAKNVYFENLFYGRSDQKEITITDISPQAFRTILQYIYTDTLNVEACNVENLSEIIGWARRHCFHDMTLVIEEKLKSIINLQNIFSILNTANLYDVYDLRDACDTFANEHTIEILKHPNFKHLTQISLVNLLQKDSFLAPELDIFKAVDKWCKDNEDKDKLAINTVRLSLLSIKDVLTTVRPSQLVDDKTLLDAIEEHVDVKQRRLQHRYRQCEGDNIATSKYDAKVIGGINTNELLTGNRDPNNCAVCSIGDKNGITVKLGAHWLINHIFMGLPNEDTSYGYYVEVSQDEKQWKKIVDYSDYLCKSQQDLYFNQEIVQYIRIVGTRSADRNVCTMCTKANHYGFTSQMIRLTFVEASYKVAVPRIVNGIVHPTTNIVTERFFVADINGTIIIQLSQPYIISSIKFAVTVSFPFEYHITTSANYVNWDRAVDLRNSTSGSWQLLNFVERPVVYIRITGHVRGLMRIEDPFHITGFECPISEES